VLRILNSAAEVHESSFNPVSVAEGKPFPKFPAIFTGIAAGCPDRKKAQDQSPIKGNP
jgi:hypothetical protein